MNLHLQSLIVQMFLWPCESILFSQLQEGPGYTFVLGIDTRLREYFLTHHIRYSCKEIVSFFVGS